MRPSKLILWAVCVALLAAELASAEASPPYEEVAGDAGVQGRKEGPHLYIPITRIFCPNIASNPASAFYLCTQIWPKRHKLGITYSGQSRNLAFIFLVCEEATEATAEEADADQGAHDERPATPGAAAGPPPLQCIRDSGDRCGGGKACMILMIRNSFLYLRSQNKYPSFVFTKKG